MAHAANALMGWPVSKLVIWIYEKNMTDEVDTHKIYILHLGGA
jgi:hypothetical protein